MDKLLLTAILAGLLLYLLIPGGGAFWVRRRWRLFRRKVAAATLFPELSYARLRQGGEGYLGEFRLLGSLQAIQGNDSIWVSSGSISIRVNLSGVEVYTLPHSISPLPGNSVLSVLETLDDETPARMSWSGMFSLPEGTRLFIAGGLVMENGQPQFRASRGKPLVVILYDGEENSILLRTIWAGRQRNEYLNDFTPGSIMAGCVSLLLLTYMAFRREPGSVTGWIILIMALTPLLIYLPPGIIFFEMYRSFWKKGRRFRAERDLLKLPLRYWPDAAGLEDCGDIVFSNGEVYGYQWFSSGEEALERVPGARLIKTCLKENPLQNPCTVFRVKRENPSRDLMVSPLILPGDPFVSYRICAGKARIMEILSGLFFIIGFGGNLILFYIVLGFFLF